MYVSKFFLFYSFIIMQTRQLYTALYSEVYYCILNYIVIMKFQKKNFLRRVAHSAMAVLQEALRLSTCLHYFYKELHKIKINLQSKTIFRVYNIWKKL